MMLLVGSTLKEVILPTSLNSIEVNTFNECSLLKGITISSTTTSIGDCEFKEFFH